VTSHEADEKVIRTLFERLSARDFDGMAEMLADDVEFDLAYAPEMLPMPVRGRDAMRELVVNVMGGMFDPNSLTPTTFYPGAEPGVIIAEYASDAVVKHTGKQYRNRYVGIFRVADGHVTFWREYHNPEIATEALTAD
jgi:ketosteroid isomerase-like protein